MVQLSDFDKILLVVIAVGAIVGLWRGFLREVVGTFGLLLAAIIANLATPYGLPHAAAWFSNEHVVGLLVWVVLFVVAMVVLGWIAHLIGKVLKAAMLSWTNRLAGAIFGAIKYALFLAVAITAVQSVSTLLPALSIQTYVEESQIVPLLHNIVSVVMPWVSENVLNPALEMLKK